MSYVSQQLFGKRRFQQIVLILTALVLVTAIAVTFIESRVPGAKIKNIFDGLWWATVTTATVGYGDYVPMTVAGRIVGLVLVVLGTTLYGTIFVIIGTTISESQERFQWRRSNEKLEEIERQLRSIQKSQEFLVGHLTKKKTA